MLRTVNNVASFLPSFTAQAQGNKTLLGPTKIYLAVHPPKPATPASPAQSQTPALAAAPQSPRKLVKTVQEGQVAGQLTRQVLVNGQPQVQAG